MRDNYAISKNRYLELKNFCLQYNEFRDRYSSIAFEQKLETEDPTGDLAIYIADYGLAIRLIETTAYNTDIFKWRSILQAVTTPVPIPTEDLPCTLSEFKTLRRKFFWLLDKEKGVV